MKTVLLVLAITFCFQICGEEPKKDKPATEYDSGDPTPDEQFVLEMINIARANLDAEAARLKIKLTEGLAEGLKVERSAPLAMNRFLLAAARGHSADMWKRSFFAHKNPDGLTSGGRCKKAGYAGGHTGENIASGDKAWEMHDRLVIDANTPLRGHRRAILNIGIEKPFREIGIGFFAGSKPNAEDAENFITEDFGGGSAGPFLLGVVYADTNQNGRYNIGEGLSGVAIKVEGASNYAVTKTAGGYAIPLEKNATYTVTASGGRLRAPLKKSVTMTTDNVKLNFAIK